MDKPFHEFLKEQMQAKGVNLGRLRQESGIAERYLIAFVEGQKDKLPALPYVRGYLIKIASVLGLNNHELWELYRREAQIRRSGPKDIMPFNRYALKPINKKWLIGGAVVFVIAAYVIINFNNFFGKSSIAIINPSSETLVTTANVISLLGKVNANDKLMIGGKEIITDAQGNFKEEYELEPGLNIIEFSVSRLLRGEIKTVRRVIYQP